jgi:hypothetical protein
LKRAERFGSSDVYYIPSSAGTETEVLTRALGVDPGDDVTADIARLVGELGGSFGFDFASVGPESVYHLQFRDPEVVKSYVELRRRTLTVLEAAGREVDIISETGDWLTRPEYAQAFHLLAQRGCRLRVIVAHWSVEDEKYAALHSDKVKRWAELFTLEGGSMEILRLPWERHDVHMTVNESGQGVYFRRRYSATSFVPVYISDRRDCDVLKAQFNWFHREAVAGAEGPEAERPLAR